MKKILERFLIYTLVIFAVAVSLPIVIEYGDIVVFAEGGPIEWLQLTLLMIAAGFLLSNALFRKGEFRELFCLLALALLSAVSRELDSTLNRYLSMGGWGVPVAACAITGTLLFWRRADALMPQVRQFVGTRAFALMWCGFIVAVPYSQLVGHGKFLELLMGDDYVRNYKRVIEELGELLGYLLLLIGSLEAVCQQKENDDAHV
ncbi:MAG: hypothetical protein IH624_11250 [Phycisphaerae bacterium]|nr:hypothetical protein [Phycisphaerae bacterium]